MLLTDHDFTMSPCPVGSVRAGDRGTKTITTAFSVEPEQMVAIGVHLDAP